MQPGNRHDRNAIGEARDGVNSGQYKALDRIEGEEGLGRLIEEKPPPNPLPREDPTHPAETTAFSKK